MTVVTTHELIKLLPEIVLFLSALFILICDMGYGKFRPKVTLGISLAGFFTALFHALISLNQAPEILFSGTLQIDPVSQFFKVLVIFTGMMTVLLGWISRDIKNQEQAEMHALVCLAALGICLMSSATHLLLLFIAGEVVGLCCQILAAFKKQSVLSSEAGVKQFVHGSLSSILFAFGIAMLYGVGKSFSIVDVRAQIATATSVGDPTIAVSYLWIAFTLVFISLASRLLVFPFHFVTVDVIEGAPTPVSAFLAVAPVFAAIAVSLRICFHLFGVKEATQWVHVPGVSWQSFLGGLAAVTMIIGNLASLFQKNLKRLLAFSCVAHMGFLLMGIAVSTQSGVASALFGLVPYAVVTMGAFFIIQGIADRAKSEDISILKGLFWKNPFEGVILAIFIFSLAGLPPFAGFIGRFYLLGAVIHEKLYWLALIAAVNWVLGLTYFLPLIRQMSISQGVAKESAHGRTRVAIHGVMTVLLVPTVFLGVYWDSLMRYLMRSLTVVSW